MVLGSSTSRLRYSNDPQVWWKEFPRHERLVDQAIADETFQAPWAGPGQLPARQEKHNRAVEKYQQVFKETPIFWKPYSDTPGRVRGIKPGLKNLKASHSAMPDRLGLYDKTLRSNATAGCLDWWQRGERRNRNWWLSTPRAHVHGNGPLDNINAVGFNGIVYGIMEDYIIMFHHLNLMAHPCWMRSW